jgi:hypothetical protein
MLDVAEHPRDHSTNSMSLFHYWSLTSLELNPALLISEDPWLFEETLTLDFGCHDILFDDRWAHLSCHHCLLCLLSDHWLPELIMNNLALLLVDDRSMLFMNDILMVLMDYWLVDLLDHLLMDDGLLMLMNDPLMMLMNNVFVVLMHDLLMLFMNHLLVVLFDDGCIHSLLHSGCLSVLNDLSSLRMCLDHPRILIMLEDLDLIKGCLNYGLV